MYLSLISSYKQKDFTYRRNAYLRAKSLESLQMVGKETIYFWDEKEYQIFRQRNSIRIPIKKHSQKSMESTVMFIKFNLLTTMHIILEQFWKKYMWIDQTREKMF